MKATLNLRFDKTTIEAAKQYAMKHGTSISEIVERHLRQLAASGKKQQFVSDNLIGVLKKYREYTDEQIKQQYLKGKHNA